MERRKPGQGPQFDMARIIELHEFGLSTEEIGREVGCSKATAARYVRKHLAAREEAQAWEESTDLDTTPDLGEGGPVAVGRDKEVLIRDRDGNLSFNEKVKDSMAQVDRELELAEQKLRKNPGVKMRGSLQSAQLKYLGERRRYLELVLAASKVAVQIEQITEWQKIVLNEIGKESEDVQRRILERLSRRAALVGFTE